VPSRSEPFGYVVLEAFCGATPVVGSAVDGIAEIVRDGVDGVLVAPGDADGLVRAVEEVTADPRRWAAHAVAVRERLDDFAYPARAGTLLRAYAFGAAPDAPPDAPPDALSHAPSRETVVPGDPARRPAPRGEDAPNPGPTVLR
jgi:hypothetical protein